MHLGRPTIRIREGATLDESEVDDGIQSTLISFSLGKEIKWANFITKYIGRLKDRSNIFLFL